MTAADDELVTAAEAAERLGVSYAAVRRWVDRRWLRAAGRVTGVRGAAPMLYRWGDVKACAEQRRANAQRYSTKPD